MQAKSKSLDFVIEFKRVNGLKYTGILSSHLYLRPVTNLFGISFTSQPKQISILDDENKYV